MGRHAADGRGNADQRPQACQDFDTTRLMVEGFITTGVLLEAPHDAPPLPHAMRAVVLAKWHAWSHAAMPPQHW